ncbi:MAG TPA: beta-ketoacyl-[acyl-carrier-protein] synthase family protein [Steroidobacteraceae bacterium]|nr:beta-ketoacyl-[acyl-carrier-protein] synthase family protein [Steroidobacteraceae bacterium]
MQPLSITAFTATCAAGSGRAELLCSLDTGRTGLAPNDFGREPLKTWVGRVAGVEGAPLPGNFSQYECRNNRLAWMGLQRDGFLEAVEAARRRYGEDRVALVLGTSTSSIGATEEAYSRLTPAGEFPEDLRYQAVHTPHSTGEFLQKVLGLNNVAVTVATACSSSAKAFAQGARLLDLGIADAVVVGGVDSLCGSVLFGFNSLALVSPEPCRPFDAERTGISIGEAAAFALLERDGKGPRLLGYGESSDAHHMSTPHPSGRGARLAMSEALRRGSVDASQVDYINLHGTASLKNDEIEAQVIAEMFPEGTHGSSTKGWTGHTLGAAGALEAVITLLALESGLMPGNLNSRALDPACGPQVRLGNARGTVRHALSNSFGFGGSNCVLLFSAADSSAPS